MLLMYRYEFLDEKLASKNNHLKGHMPKQRRWIPRQLKFDTRKMHYETGYTQKPTDSKHEMYIPKTLHTKKKEKPTDVTEIKERIISVSRWNGKSVTEVYDLVEEEQKKKQKSKPDSQPDESIQELIPEMEEFLNRISENK